MAAAKKTQKKEKLNKKASKTASSSKTSNSKTAKKTTKKKISAKNIDSSLAVGKSSTNQKFYDQLKLSESYVSLVLGAIVVIGISALFLFYLKESRSAVPTKPEVLNSSVSPVLTKTPVQTYTMGENETLWDVAVKFYGDGFAYPKIIEANKDKIENADFVPPGTVIIIPDAK
jgi:nucleoid-associated protein YgaU